MTNDDLHELQLMARCWRVMQLHWFIRKSAIGEGMIPFQQVLSLSLIRAVIKSHTMKS
jgi:hypothetical protein